MNVVVDTIVLVSGQLIGGVPAQIRTACVSGAFVRSPRILSEYRRVGRALAKGRSALDASLHALLTMIVVHPTAVNPPSLLGPC